MLLLLLFVFIPPLTNLYSYLHLHFFLHAVIADLIYISKFVVIYSTSSFILEAYGMSLQKCTVLAILNQVDLTGSALPPFRSQHFPHIYIEIPIEIHFSYLILSFLFLTLLYFSFLFFPFLSTYVFFCICLFLYFERIFSIGSPPSSSSLTSCWSLLPAAALFLYALQIRQKKRKRH